MLTNAKLVYQPHDHLRCINAAISRAKELCQQNSVRLTPIRESVLRILWQQHRPLGAYQIQDQLSRIAEKPVAPPTVYRAIEFLLEQGLIHRISSLNAYIGCPFTGSNHSNLFMICNNCGNTAEVAQNNINSLLQDTSKRVGFTLQSQSLELFGLCPQCSSTSGPSAIPDEAYADESTTI